MAPHADPITATTSSQSHWVENIVAVFIAVIAVACASPAGRPASPSPEFAQSFVTRLGLTGRPAISRDGARIAYVLRDDIGYSLLLRNRDGTEKKLLASEPGTILRGEAFTPDGNAVDAVRVGADKSVSLWRVSIEGGAARKILDEVGSVPAWSPSGDRMAFIGSQGERLIIADKDGAGARTILSRVAPDRLLSFANSARVIAPAWSPDGRSIAVLASSKGVSQIIVVDLGTGTERAVLPMAKANASGLVWLDSTTLVGSFQSKPSSPRQLWKIAVPSGQSSRLFEDDDNYDGVAISSGGTMVAGRSTAHSSIWVADADGSGAKVLAEGLSEISPPVGWRSNDVLYGAAAKDGVSEGRTSPDDRSVAEVDATGINIIVRGKDGGAHKQITHFSDGQFIGTFQWSPDGKKLAFSRWSVSNDVVLIERRR